MCVGEGGLPRRRRGLGPASHPTHTQLPPRARPPLTCKHSTPCTLQAVKAKCSQFIPAEHVVLLRLDVLGPQPTLAAAVETAFAAFDGAGLDYIFHNAGASQHAVVEETSQGVATELLHLNLHAAINVARATLPAMLAAGKGWHVVIASMAGVVPSPGQAVYAAAKAGLRAYFGSLKAEMAGSGIGATICCPGPVATGMDGNARLVYGPVGLMETLGQPECAASPTADGEGSQLVAKHSSAGRTPVPRAVQLIMRAAHHKMDEVWIARHPVLFIGAPAQREGIFVGVGEGLEGGGGFQGGRGDALDGRGEPGLAPARRDGHAPEPLATNP